MRKRRIKLLNNKYIIAYHIKLIKGQMYFTYPLRCLRVPLVEYHWIRRTLINRSNKALYTELRGMFRPRCQFGGSKWHYEHKSSSQGSHCFIPSTSLQQALRSVILGRFFLHMIHKFKVRCKHQKPEIRNVSFPIFISLG
jgi:hypothetical protein